MAATEIMITFAGRLPLTGERPTHPKSPGFTKPYPEAIVSPARTAPCRLAAIPVKVAKLTKAFAKCAISRCLLLESHPQSLAHQEFELTPGEIKMHSLAAIRC